MTTMKELLDIPRFSDLKVINASANLSLTVKSIEISETPDVALYIPKNALLLTTAMSYKDNQQDLITLIDSLIRVDSAGIGIKVGRFLGEIDQTVIDYANSVQFPLIQIPNTTPLGTLSHQLLNYLWDTKTEKMSFALDIQKRFSNLLMNDASVARFIADFGKMIKTPVILLDPFKEVIAQSKAFTRTGKVAVAEYYVEQVLLKKPHLLENETDSFLIKDIDGHEIQISIHPIKGNNYFPYFLLILKPEQIPYPISEFAVDQACMVLSFVLYKNLKVEESMHNLGGDYFAQLIESQQLLENKTKNWLDSGLNFGIVNSNFYQVIYIHCQHDYQNEWKKQYNREKSHLASNWLSEKLIPYFRDAQIFHIKNNNHLVLLLQSKYENLDDILEKTAADLEKILPISLVFSVGHSYNKIEMISSSFIEAKMSFEEVYGKNHQHRINYYHSRGMMHLFENIQTDEVHYFCQDTLKELAYPKEESMIELRRTLKTYLDNQCEITKTSKILFIHRNTVKYRIEQCEKILGTPINEPSFSLNLRLALTLSENNLD